MGNQIVCPSGSDWYRKDLILRNYQIIDSLFDGTFSLSFKVENIYNKKLKVAKVFWIDSSQTKKIVEMFYKTFEKMNKIPTKQVFGNLFSEPYVTSNGAYLIRPYLEQPLTEKITDSPPLHYWEKKWIAFQLLQSVSNLGEQGFWHGDIKPENVMIGESLRVSLVDHAPFKPSMIGKNQPHYFIHFFSYMRSCCFLAPERIADSNKYINFFAADIFSVACVIAYMYLDGCYLFNYTTVQQLKDNPEIQQLDNIRDVNIRNLLRGLIIVDYRSRLKNFKNFKSFFPSWFPEFYNRFKNTLNDESPNSILYSFSKEFLNSIFASNNSMLRSRRKSTSDLEFSMNFDSKMNPEIQNLKSEKNKKMAKAKQDMNDQSISESLQNLNKNSICERVQNTNSRSLLEGSNKKMAGISSLERAHHANSQIIYKSSQTPISKGKSTPIIPAKSHESKMPFLKKNWQSSISILKMDDPLIICIPILSHFITTAEMNFNDYCNLIRLFVHLSIRLKDPILKLSRCVPYLISLFELGNAVINMISLNGLISIISSISNSSFKNRLLESNSSNDPENIDLIKMIHNYPSNYLIPRLYSSVKGSWAPQFFARLPFLILHISRLWPSFLIDVHNKRIFQNDLAISLNSMKPFIRSSSQISVSFYNYRKKLRNSKNKVHIQTSLYPLFVCFNKYMKFFLNSADISELTHFYSMYITNFQPSDLNKFVKNDLLELIGKMSILLTNNPRNLNGITISLGKKKLNKNLSNNNVSILVFFYEVMKFFEMNLPINVITLIGSSTVKMQFSADCRLRTVSRQILKVLPDSLSFIKFCSVPPSKKLTRTNTFTSKKSIAVINDSFASSKSKEAANNEIDFAGIFRKIENSIKNDAQLPSLLYSQKLFSGEVDRVILNSSRHFTFFHSKSVLSLFEYNEDLLLKFKEIRAMNFHEKIDFLSPISNGQILLTAGSKMHLISNIQLKATFSMPSQIIMQTVFNNGVLTVSKNSPSTVSVRRIDNLMEPEFDFDFGNKSLTCIEEWEGQPLFSIGTSDNFLYSVDSRVKSLVSGFHINHPFHKIVTFAFSPTCQFGLVSDESIEFYDPRQFLLSNKIEPFFAVKGKSDVIMNYYNGVLMAGSNGTFFVNPNSERALIPLFDNVEFRPVEKMGNGRFDFSLPDEYKKSLNGHLFQISSVDYMKNTGLCCSGDNCGYVHLWTPPHLKYLNGV